MAAKKQTSRTGWREVWGIACLVLCILMFMSLISYDPSDIPVLTFPPHDPTINFIGPTGAWFAFASFMLLGVCGYLLPAVIAGLGVLLLFKREGRIWTKFLLMLTIFLSILALAELGSEWWEGLKASINVEWTGGALGYLFVQEVMIRYLGAVGTGIIAVSGLLTGIILLAEIHPVTLWKRSYIWIVAIYERIAGKINERRDRREQLIQEEREISKRRRRLEEAMLKRDKAMSDDNTRKEAVQIFEPVPDSQDEVAGKHEPDEESQEAVFTSGFEPGKKKSKEKEAGDDKVVTASPAASAYSLPQLTLLDESAVDRPREIKEDYKAAGTILKETLAEFGIDAEVTNVERGPVVTRYELLPAPGVRVERITGLSNNIALVMKAESVRVQAPIPGKGVVGIEVPNTLSTFVYLREMMESPAWRNTKHALPLALGKDVGGHELIADLADMPHMLIAGATGSGKTVCMNSILAGLLMSRTPEEMRLMLIDPKIVEFTAFDRLPHLVVPVITDPKKVSLGLRWAINEMEKRYKLFAKVGVRNIASYNNRTVARQTDMFGEEGGEDREHIPEHLPYLVIIVDELADLMLAAQAEIENSIARLAQLSRAVGIHMILATQRPSVNVITGTIKANFPARVAFQVAQKVDSRTILDAAGADKLLGKGDMLFLPPGSSKLIRAQGTMTTDDEIRRIVEFIREQAEPQYEHAIKEKIENKAAVIPEAEEDDEMLEAAIEVIRQTRRASTSSLQRRLRIGYTRAARLMDLLEERGIVGAPQGSDPREILIDLDGDIPQNEMVDNEN